MAVQVSIVITSSLNDISGPNVRSLPSIYASASGGPGYQLGGGGGRVIQIEGDQERKGNVNGSYNFPKSMMMSSNVLFCATSPKLKYIDYYHV